MVQVAVDPSVYVCMLLSFSGSLCLCPINLCSSILLFDLDTLEANDPMLQAAP